MQFKMIHENYNVADLAVSIPFYEEALGLHEVRRKEAQDGSFIIVYLANDASDFEILAGDSSICKIRLTQKFTCD